MFLASSGAVTPVVAEVMVPNGGGHSGGSNAAMVIMMLKVMTDKTYQ